MLIRPPPNGGFLNSGPRSLPPARSVENDDDSGLIAEDLCKDCLAVLPSDFALALRVKKRRQMILQQIVDLSRKGLILGRKENATSYL